MDRKFVVRPKQFLCSCSLLPLKVFVCRWWMGHYSSCTPKRHICWSNSRKIGGLDKGPLTKDERREIASTGVKSATIKVNKKGRKTYSGTTKLRGTGWGAKLFSFHTLQQLLWTAAALNVHLIFCNGRVNSMYYRFKERYVDAIARKKIVSPIMALWVPIQTILQI